MPRLTKDYATELAKVGIKWNDILDQDHERLTQRAFVDGEERIIE